MICFVILHYQAILETQNCIASIKKNVNDEKKIIVIDNASPNQTGKDLLKMYENDNEIEFILLDKNIGFAKGNNLGYKKAKEFKPDFIIVLNSDTLLTKDDFVIQLWSAYKKYNFDILGPDIYSTKTNSHQNPQREKNYTLDELRSVRKRLIIKNRFKFLLKIKYLFKRNNKEKIEKRNYEDIQFGKVLHGAFYAFSKKFIELHNNCFYNETFMYFESYILHYLGLKSNLLLLYYPEIKVIHHEDASTNLSYNNQYKKSCFVNKCLLDSCECFIRIMLKDSYKI